MLTLLIVGLIAGILAKAIVPGTSNEPSGWLMTILLGVGGAFFGGFLARIMGIHAWGFFGQVLVATGGAVALIALSRAFARGRF
jgi:uncharacterized membrane protein YeaQ/YmgE (transglycosylase-associated protein family)